MHQGKRFIELYDRLDFSGKLVVGARLGWPESIIVRKGVVKRFHAHILNKICRAFRIKQDEFFNEAQEK